MIRSSLLFLGALILVAKTGHARAQTPPARLHFIDVQDGHALLIDVGGYEILFAGGAGLGDHLGAYLRNNKIIDGDLDLLIVSDGHHYSYQAAGRLFFPTGSGPAAPAKIAEVWTPGDIAEWKNSNCKSGPAFRMSGSRRSRPRTKPGAILHSADRGRRQHRRDGAVARPSDQGIPAERGDFGSPAKPGARSRECARLINQGAIVLALEIHGVRILLAGDVETKHQAGHRLLERRASLSRGSDRGQDCILASVRRCRRVARASEGQRSREFTKVHRRSPTKIRAVWITAEVQHPRQGGFRPVCEETGHRLEHREIRTRRRARYCLLVVEPCGFEMPLWTDFGKRTGRVARSSG